MRRILELVKSILSTVHVRTKSITSKKSMVLQIEKKLDKEL